MWGTNDILVQYLWSRPVSFGIVPDRKIDHLFSGCELKPKKNSPIQVRNLLTNCTYLEDESVEVMGLKIFGSPWQPDFSQSAFSLQRGEQLREKWAKIPEETEVLVTHAPPPLGIG